MDGEEAGRVILLGIVQGVTEFLPVSSSAHLEIVETLTGGELWESAPLLLPVALHLGTLFSVLTVYRKQWTHFVRNILYGNQTAIREGVFLVLSVVPAVIAFMLMRPFLERWFEGELFATGLALMGTGLVLLGTEHGMGRHLSSNSTAEVFPTWKRTIGLALGMGVAQALALFPGISRSGMTISAGLWMGVPRQEAVRLSFWMGCIPILGGALLEVYEIGVSFPKEGGGVEVNWIMPVSGAIIAWLTGILAIRGMMRWVQNRRWWIWGVYCLVVGGWLVLKFYP